MSAILEPPVQLSASDRQELQRALHQVIPHTEVWAFGSRAWRVAKPYSDLDLAIVQEHPLSIEALANMHHALDACDLSIRVDLADWAAISEGFRHLIAKDKVLTKAAQPAHHQQH